MNWLDAQMLGNQNFSQDMLGMQDAYMGQQAQFSQPTFTGRITGLDRHCSCRYCGRMRASEDLKKCESCGAPPK